jgi:outer membrane protein assembly factor BamB
VTGDLSAGSGSCLAAAIWDLTNQRLFVGGNKTTISGASSPGSIRRLNPATGAVMWAAPLAGGPVMGSPTLSGGGVIAAGTFNNTTPSANRVYLLSAADGSVVNSIVTGSSVFAQPVFADTRLFIATTKGTLTSFSPTSP